VVGGGGKWGWGEGIALNLGEKSHQVFIL
jgi:hypothetical protein